MEAIGLQGFASLFIVLGLVGALAYLARRGVFNQLRSRNRGMSVETAMPLGERRSLMIVSVEGRRLLIGLTPMQVSLVTELSAARESFDDTLARSVSSPSPASPATS